MDLKGYPSPIFRTFFHVQLPQSSPRNFFCFGFCKVKKESLGYIENIDKLRYSRGVELVNKEN